MLEDILVPIFAIIFIFGAPAAVLWQWIASRHRERLTIIERGLDPAQYSVLYATKFRAMDPLNALKWGLMVSFLGAGLWLGSWLVQVYQFPHYTTWGVTLMGGGIGLSIYYMIAIRSAKWKAQQQTSDVQR